jgi:hypothetical protein
MGQSILILLGNQNLQSGELTEAARLRCDRAIELLNGEQSLQVLPTGAFGAHFNKGSKPHGKYLAEYLVEHGISSERILPHTNSSNTLEDGLVARQRLYDAGFCAKGTKLYVVTNKFHLSRVEYVFSRLFPDVELFFIEAPNPKDEDMCRAMRKHEHLALEKLKLEWTDVPLYRAQEFPDCIYENASAEHKHYDNLSVYAITGILLAFAFPLSAFEQLQRLRVHLALVMSAIVMFFLWGLYLKFARFAAVGRRVMKWLEVAFDRRGFSAIYPRGSKLGIKEGVSVLVTLFLAALAILYFVLWKRHLL